MAKIIVTLNSTDIGTLLLGGEVEIESTTNQFDNLTGIVIKGDIFTNIEENKDD